MRILWVKLGGLWPLNTGGRLRSFHIIAELARRHRVTLVTTHGPRDDPAGLAAQLVGCEVISLPYAAPKQGSARFVGAVLGSWLSPFPVDVWRWRIPAVRNEVARLMTREKFDLCVADFLYTTPNVPLDGPVATVLFAHNVEHIIWQRLGGIETRPWRRALLELEWRKMRRYEAEACTRARLTVAVSDADRLLLASHAPKATVRTIPTGVDTTYFTPNGSQETRGALVFTGSMDWFPNEDCILYFTEAVLPRIRDAAPDVTLTVVGKNPGPRVQRLAAIPGVRVTGTVDDVRPYVAASAVCVVPLRVHRRGGGSAAHPGDALRSGGRSGGVRGRGRRAPPGSRSAQSARRRRTSPGGGALLVAASGSRVRSQMRGGSGSCALTCSGLAMWDR